MPVSSKHKKSKQKIKNENLRSNLNVKGTSWGLASLFGTNMAISKTTA